MARIKATPTATLRLVIIVESRRCLALLKMMRVSVMKEYSEV
jgi:hypothetical protein